MKTSSPFSHKLHPLFCLILLTFSSCALIIKSQSQKSFPKKTMAKPAPSEWEQHWKEIQKQKSKDIKLQKIENFIKAYKNKEVALEAYLLKSQTLLKQGKQDLACLNYYRVVNSPVHYTHSWKAYHAAANCDFKKENIKQALETLEKLIQNKQETSENKKASAKLQWSFLTNKTSSHLPSLTRWKLNNLSHLYLFSSDNKEQQMWWSKASILINSLPLHELLFYGEQNPLPPFEGYFLYKIGEYFLSYKNLKKAKKYFKRVSLAKGPLYLKTAATAKINLIHSISQVNPYLIGVLVPLSGRRKALGKKILKGLYMGLEMDKNSPWQILVMDSKSHPDVVRAHLDSLFYKHHVIGLIGGLTNETAEVIAKKAEEFFTPAILFSQKKDLNLNRDFVFQNSVTAEQILKPLVEELRVKLKIKKAAILHSDDLYGKEYASLFADTFKNTGGEIIHYEIYKTGEVDFKKHIKNLLHLNIKGRTKEFEKLKEEFLKENPTLSERSRKLTPDNLLPAKKDFEVLFIPDSFYQLQKIKDHLQYFGVKNIYLSGTNLWKYDQTKSWTKDLPLVFVNLPKQSRAFLGKSHFHKQFVKIYLKPPGLFEQRAYNTALFLKKGLEKKVRSRLALQKELQSIKSFQGAYYTISISKDRVFLYPLYLYKTKH